jgi:GntR family transcriptional regulator
VIDFYLTRSTAVPTYMQLVQQVRQGLRLGLLEPGDRLPTVREVASHLAINPNTVLKAYRELEHERLVEGRPGQGTFVVKALAGPSPRDRAVLGRSLENWIGRARAAGMDDDQIHALIDRTLRLHPEQETA